MRNDDELEKYLSEFRLRAVRPLERPPATSASRTRLAVAAVVLLCAGIGLWYARPDRDAVRPASPALAFETVPATAQVTATMNAFALTRLALEDDGRFRAQMAAESRMVLPTLHGEQSMLRVLAKD